MFELLIGRALLRLIAGAKHPLFPGGQMTITTPHQPLAIKEKLNRTVADIASAVNLLCYKSLTNYACLRIFSTNGRFAGASDDSALTRSSLDASK